MSLSRNHDDPDEASLSNSSFRVGGTMKMQMLIALSLKASAQQYFATEHMVYMDNRAQAHAVAATIPRKGVPVSCSPDVGQLAASCESPCLGDREL